MELISDKYKQLTDDYAEDKLFSSKGHTRRAFSRFLQLKEWFPFEKSEISNINKLLSKYHKTHSKLLSSDEGIEDAEFNIKFYPNEYKPPLSISITKGEDEYFLLTFSDRNGVSVTYFYYKVDQLDGLLDCIVDIFHHKKVEKITERLVRKL